MYLSLQLSEWIVDGKVLPLDCHQNRGWLRVLMKLFPYFREVLKSGDWVEMKVYIVNFQSRVFYGVGLRRKRSKRSSALRRNWQFAVHRVVYVFF